MAFHEHKQSSRARATQNGINYLAQNSKLALLIHRTYYSASPLLSSPLLSSSHPNPPTFEPSTRYIRMTPFLEVQQLIDSRRLSTWATRTRLFHRFPRISYSIHALYNTPLPPPPSPSLPSHTRRVRAHTNTQISPRGIVQPRNYSKASKARSSRFRRRPTITRGRSISSSSESRRYLEKIVLDSDFKGV